VTTEYGNLVFILTHRRGSAETSLAAWLRPGLAHLVGPADLGGARIVALARGAAVGVRLKAELAYVGALAGRRALAGAIQTAPTGFVRWTEKKKTEMNWLQCWIKQLQRAPGCFLRGISLALFATVGVISHLSKLWTVEWDIRD